jgi:hypothetical protein
MYDLTVDVAHTFVVGDAGWLVHNAGPSQRLRPDPQATGMHSTFITDDNGSVRKYATWHPNEYTGGWTLDKRFDPTGKPHFNKKTGQMVPTPHVQGPSIEGGVRAAEPWEIPRGCS